MTLQVLSMVPGIVWPAIPNARAAQMLAMQFQLEQSQWLSADELRERQSSQLAALLRHAYETVPFYRERFEAFGWQGVLELREWGKLPLLSRRDIQQAGDGLHSNITKEHGPLMATVTSGSSGQPVKTLSTTVTRLFHNALILRNHVWHRRDLSLKLAAIRWFKQGSQNSAGGADNWGAGTRDIVQTGPVVLLDVHTSLEQQAAFLLEHDPDYLITYPSIVSALADHFANAELRLTRLREVRTFGEVLDEQVRDKCRAVWNAPVVDSYSSEEVGDIALQCPEREHYHVQSENLLVEVLDDEGGQCPPGEIGRLVITTLHNFAMPLIRYDIGDFAEMGPPCPCGRGLPVLKRIVGRQRNMFILPDGRRVWPSLDASVIDAVDQLPPIYQFQLIQRTRESLELLVVAPRVFTEAETVFVRELVDEALNCKLELKITHVAEIPRGPSGKYEDFRCEAT